jgi:hypothetical protein
LKLYQGQQMVLGSAVHSIMEKLDQENEQIDDQQGTLARSFKGLLDNVATRADMEEIQVFHKKQDNVRVFDLFRFRLLLAKITSFTLKLKIPQRRLFLLLFWFCVFVLT